jgi:RNA polymerase sigma-70 factor (ECF subfamily)
MPDPTSTQALLQRIQTGDKGALNELYNRYLMRVLAAVRARLGAELRGKLESWDVVQDALLASLKNVQSFNQTSEGAFLNWLAKVVENRIRDQLDFFRADKRDHRLERPLAGPRSAESSAPLDIPERSGVPTPSQFLVLSEDLARLEKAMDQLPEESRELIVAVKIEGRTYDEIAQNLGRSPDAVRMQVKRALLALTNAFRVLEGESRPP